MNNIQAVNAAIAKVTNTVQSYGVGLRSSDKYSDQALFNQQGLPSAEISMIYRSLEEYWGIIAQGPVENESEQDQNKRHLATFLKKFGLRVSKKIFDSLESDHIVEVFTKNHQQIFRSVNFFSLSSYSLETLTFIPWDKLFYRKNTDQQNLISCISYVMEGRIESMVPSDTRHILTEIDTEKKFRYQLHRIGCIFDTNSDDIMGFMSLLNVTELTDNLKMVQ